VSPDVDTRADAARPVELPATQPAVCPYCGDDTGGGNRCRSCGGALDPLSKQATQNEMGPWFVRDITGPFRPGCRYETIERFVRRGRIRPETVVRGPSTGQFWTTADRAPGIARLLGLCHSCGAGVGLDHHVCERCGATLDIAHDRQHLGLGAERSLPGAAQNRPAPTQAQQATPASQRSRRSQKRSNGRAWWAAVLGLLIGLAIGGLLAGLGNGDDAGDAAPVENPSSNAQAFHRQQARATKRDAPQQPAPSDAPAERNTPQGKPNDGDPFARIDGEIDAILASLDPSDPDSLARAIERLREIAEAHADHARARDLLAALEARRDLQPMTRLP